MTVLRCHLCDEDPEQARYYGGQGLTEGLVCPICYRPTCRFHLTTVRWRWRQNSQVDSAMVCRVCQRSYAHRDWDALNRDWIT